VDDDLFPPLPPAPPAPERPRALSVADLGRALKASIEGGWANPVWVEGEVTGARPAPKGHHYFSLRDEREDASIDMVMYRTSLTQRARSLLVDGARVRLRGRPTFWAPRGRLQFVVDRVDPAGRGALLEALEQRKEKLAAEGLFDPSRRRKLPADPRVIGVVTSSSGAVIHDICKVAFRRGGARILLAAAQVQGAGAAGSIVRAIGQLQRVREVDVIIVGRGGGSLDDLLPFSEENVVRAVAGCRVPVVSAVGHEVDVSLTDFAADARAATPSQAAELVVPDRAGRRMMLDHLRTRLHRSMRGRLHEARGALDRRRHRLRDPRVVLASFQQHLDDRRGRLEAILRRRLAREREEHARLQHRLARRHPLAILGQERARLHRVADRLRVLVQAVLARRSSSLHAAAGRLDVLSPLKVLARGYAIAQTTSGRAVRTAADVKSGERILIRAHAARLVADVVAVRETKEK
jgi:exodeoxyribonuclease VII large subunit